MAFCINCGHQFAGSEKFCASCGIEREQSSLSARQQPSYVTPPTVIASAAPSESGMSAALKGLILWFVLTIILLGIAFREGPDARVGVLVITGFIALAYVIGKVRAARRRGAVVSNTWAAYGAVTFLILTTVISIATNSSPETHAASAQPAEASVPVVPTPSPVEAISADALFSAYDQNEVEADQTYKGRTMTINGRVGSINKDFTNSVYIILPSSQNMFEGVHAEIVDTEAAKSAQLRKGQRISLTCEVEGKVVMDVIAKNCSIG